MEKVDLDRLGNEARDVDAGGSISPLDNVSEEPALPRDAYALLAQANLLRMRGHWEEAAERCMAALRLAPDSSSANSLLGDIYENQGRYDDAAQWYRMALDANPDSPADQLKLGRLRQRIEAQADQNRLAGTSRSREPRSSDPSTAIPPTVLSHSKIPELLWDPEVLLRYGAVAAGLALILVVSCAYIMVHHAGSRSNLGFGSEAIVKSPPVVVPPVAGVLPADPDTVTPRDPSERSLLVALQGSHDLTALGTTIYDVSVDPRTSCMTITFGLSSSPVLTQAQVTHDAQQILQAAAVAAPAADRFTARGLLVPISGSSGSDLAFEGDATREALLPLSSAGTNSVDTQPEGVFTNIWWSTTANIRA